MKESLEVAKRWFPDPSDAKTTAAKASRLESGDLGDAAAGACEWSSANGRPPR
jgi:hypothetical protein